MKIEMSNKEAVDILTAYLKEHSSVDEVHRALANCMLDYSRLYRFYKKSVFQSDNDEERVEYFRFFRRLVMNIDSIQKVLLGLTNEPFVCSKINEEFLDESAMHKM